jgi:hypothetical protein
MASGKSDELKGCANGAAGTLAGDAKLKRRARARQRG